MILFLECLPHVCQVPTFSFPPSSRLFSLKPSGIAAERNPPCICSLFPQFFVQSQHLLEPLSDSFRLHTAHVQSALGIHKTEVAPLSVDLTEMNKQKNKCIHSKREREREKHIYIVMHVIKKKNWVLVFSGLAIFCTRLCPPDGWWSRDWSWKKGMNFMNGDGDDEIELLINTKTFWRVQHMIKI